MSFYPNHLTTLVHPYYVARGEDDENGSAGAPAVMTLTTQGDFAQKPATALDLFKFDLLTPRDTRHFAEHGVNGVAFCFSGGSADGKTFTFNIYGWANENGPAVHVLQGTGTLGTQQVVKYPHNGLAPDATRYWADTLEVSWENWFKEVEATDGTGHNTVAHVWFDSCGYRYFFIEILNADGSTGTEAGDVACFYRYF